MEIVRKINDNSRETIIKQSWIAPGGEAKVVMTNGDGDNSGAKFSLEIDGGQVSSGKVNIGAKLEMCGSWERECFIELLKQIIVEFELIDGKQYDKSN
jgi:hypothetical protein